MSKKISGAEYPLAKIFSSDFEYVIPSYQRPYAWSILHVSELFDDLYEFYKSEKDESYFLGSIVLIKQEGIPLAEVIDGQQRLTSLTILLAVIASKMIGNERDTLAKYLKEPGNTFEGLEPKPRLTLRERDRKFFEKHIQNLDVSGLLSLDFEILDSEAQVNIAKNCRHFFWKIEEKFGQNSSDLNDFVKFILQRCFLVTVCTPSQQSAFRVFSVMNSRGLDLQPTDIIKADIIGQLKTEAEREDYNDRWEAMEVELGRSGFNDLFSYVRMIYAKEKAKKSLLDEFRTQVLPKIPKPQILIDDVLEPYAAALVTIKGMHYEATAHAEEVNTNLKWLNHIDNSDWIPAAIFFLANNENSSEYVAWFFNRLERLAAYMHVCGLNVNERIERYSKVIVSLEGKHALTNPVGEVELTSEEKEKMRTALSGNIYDLTPRRRNYIILRLDSFLSDGAAFYDSTLLTIEHVLPQTVDPASEWASTWPDMDQRKNWVHKIANLVPLNRRRNAQAQNFDFARKKTAYFSGKNGVSSYIVTTQVLNSPLWSPEHVTKRQEELLDVFAENWKLRP